MGIIDSELLKENLDGLADRLAGNPASGFVTPRVSTTLLEDVRAVSRFTQYGKDFEFRCDESEGRGGRGEAPSPLRYLLTSLAFCQQVWYAKGAAIVGCEIEALDIDDVSPMANPFPLVNVLRADEPGHDDVRAEILAAAPSVEDGQFRVPPVLGEAP